MTDKIVILSTCSTEEEAERLARLLVDARLAACVTVIPRMRSFYRWKGATESADECLLLIKSSRELFDSVRSRLETVHSYEVPELLALPVVEGAANYMDWLSTNLRKGGDGLSNKLQLETESLAAGLCLIFDMDGVIVDSNPVHRQAWAAFNRRFGLETTEEMLRNMYGKRNDEIVRDFFGDGLTPEEVASRGAAKEELYRDMVRDRVEEILVPGVRQFLERYRDVPKALATNGEPANVDFLLDRAGLRPYFRVLVNGQQVRHPKPYPEIYQRAAELLDADPANCIVFEDSHSGVEAARAAGMRIVLLCTTHGNLPGVSISVDNFLSGELRTWLADQSRSV